MNRIDADKLASIEFTLNWVKDGTHHTHKEFAPRVNFWRDILPKDLCSQLMGCRDGDRISTTFVPGGLLPENRQQEIRTVPLAQWNGKGIFDAPVRPATGRFYPKGILRNIPGIFPENRQPFRCLSINDRKVVVDFNHPMAGLPLSLSASVSDVREKFDERGGTSTDWMETAMTGPGMQCRTNGRPTDFFGSNPFLRTDGADDALFYQRPRMINHIDDTAVASVSELYGRLVSPGMRVLDLMASWTSHLPETVSTVAVTGLGLNAAELDANKQLCKRLVHDLNADPNLPLASGSFDAVVCTVSVEYLTRSFEVFADVARVLATGGIFVVTFSNRWFPPKAVGIWTELHDFERMGLVAEYFLQSDRYRGLETFSSRGRPRPATDKYAGRLPFSDPVYAVWARRK